MSEEQISEEVASYIDRLNKELETERVRRMTIENQAGLGQLSSLTPDKDKNLVQYQLDFKEELDKIFHFLSGHEIKEQNGEQIWVDPEDDRLKIFSPYGVKTIMNVLSMYLNRNTLLSFYDDKTIRWKVRDLGIELSDLFLNRYEALIFYPSPEELFDLYKPIIKSEELQITEEELYEKCVYWSQEELKTKERHIPIIALALIDMVHSAYGRAFMGKERKSLGERGININQNNNGMEEALIPQPKMHPFRPSTWK